jgi:hypothetical protein
MECSELVLGGGCWHKAEWCIWMDTPGKYIICGSVG